MKHKLDTTDKPDPRHRKGRSGGKSASPARWLVAIFLMAMTISALFSLLSQELLGAASLFGAFAVLLAIIAIGIFFDMVGVAVTAAEEKPFHSMAARKVPGGLEGIWLLRNAGKVSSVCNDVVGDICGIISGTAATAIAAEAWLSLQQGELRRPSQTVIQILLSALVAALTILPPRTWAVLLRGCHRCAVAPCRAAGTRSPGTVRRTAHAAVARRMDGISTKATGFPRQAAFADAITTVPGRRGNRNRRRLSRPSPRRSRSRRSSLKTPTKTCLDSGSARTRRGLASTSSQTAVRTA